MSISNQIRISGNIGSMGLNSTVEIESGGAANISETIAAAKTGQLTTRTDANTGTLTMAASHGITTGAKIDLYWTGGRRYNVEVGTVSVNSVPIDNGSGDDLPANLTDITAQVQQIYSIATGGEDAALFAVKLAARGHVEFRQADNTATRAMDLIANQIEHYYNDGEFPPNDGVDFTVTTKVAVTQAGTSEALFECGVAFDPGP